MLSYPEIEQLLEDLQLNCASYRFWRRNYEYHWVDRLKVGERTARLLVWIAETSVYSAQKVNIDQPKSSLRSLPMQIVPFHNSRFDYIYEVSKLRDNWLRRNKIVIDSFPINLVKNGRFLVYYPELNLADGAANVATNGFFTNHNLPPWDCWVDYFEEQILEDASVWNKSMRNYLLSWIPNELVRHVDKGVKVNPEKCIQWLSESDTMIQIIFENIFSVYD